MKKFVVVLFVLCGSFFLPAQDIENTDTTSVEDLEAQLFGENTETVLDAEDVNSKKLSEKDVTLKASLEEASVLLETEKLKIGGRLDSGLSLNYVWTDPFTKKADLKKAFTNPEVSVFQTLLAAQLFFDARPTNNSKIYGKFDFGVPFEKEIQGVSTIQLPPPGASFNIPVVVSGVPNFSVRELYVDFSAKDIAFFRFGKHAVKWGTGYFYSPADILNISRIDPQDPEAEKEGPISFRTHVIIPKTQHNIWLYLLPPTKLEKFNPKYTGGAIKFDLVFGDWELGVGGFYRYEKAPRLVTTLSGSIVNKISIFAEGIFAWGSDYTYHKNDSSFSEYTEKKKPFFQATIGGSYSITKTKSTIALQYYYNGFGYKKPYDVFYSALTKANDKSTFPPNTSAIKTISDMTAMNHLGQHYIAFTFNQAELGTDKLSLNFFQEFAISELETTSVLTFNWNIYKFVKMNTSLMLKYPLSSTSLSKGAVGWSLGFKLGGGKF